MADVHDRTFEIGGETFQLGFLTPEKSLRGLDLLAQKMLPALVEVITTLRGSDEIDEEKAFSQIAQGAAALPDFYVLFAEICKWKKDGNFVDLKLFPMVFARRPTLLLAWLSRCLREEYADFFGVAGRSLVGSMVNDWTSLIGSTGESGG